MSDYYGDGNKYRGMVSRESEVKTYHADRFDLLIERLEKFVDHAYLGDGSVGDHIRGRLRSIIDEYKK